jgi:DNA-binding response OmpR family regulator
MEYACALRGDGPSRSEPPEPRERGEGKRVLLVVDDDDDTRDMLAEILARAGYRVHGAASAAEALRIMSELAEPPRLAIVDLAMPGASGLDLIREMRQTPKLAAVSVLVLTGLVGQRQAGEELAVEGWLEKPPTMNELLAMVDGLSRRS